MTVVAPQDCCDEVTGGEGSGAATASSATVVSGVASTSAGRTPCEQGGVWRRDRVRCGRGCSALVWAQVVAEARAGRVRPTGSQLPTGTSATEDDLRGNAEGWRGGAARLSPRDLCRGKGRGVGLDRETDFLNMCILSTIVKWLIPLTRIQLSFLV